jgi:hypothetical protein
MDVRRITPVLLGLALACSKSSGDDGGAAKADTKARPALDADRAAEAIAAIESAPPEAHPKIASHALRELEAERIPSGLIDALAALEDTPPDMRVKMLAPGLSEADTRALADRLCNGRAWSVFQELEDAAPGQGGVLLWANCELASAKLVDEARAASVDPGHLLVVHLIHAALKEGGGVDDAERRLLETMLRAPPPGP